MDRTVSELVDSLWWTVDEVGRCADRLKTAGKAEAYDESLEVADRLTNLRMMLNERMERTPILCVGETLQEREGGKAKPKVEGQLKEGLKAVDATEAGGMVIAYEPIWAIGTGKTATPEDAQEMCSFIRTWLSEAYGDQVANSLRILYGGSVKPDNASELMAMEDIDGALVGGASLKADDFAAIAKYRT